LTGKRSQTCAYPLRLISNWYGNDQVIHSIRSDTGTAPIVVYVENHGLIG
jgi:hypothetical protein